MFKTAILSTLLLSSMSYAAIDVAISDNNNKSITLSKNNINRLFINSDKVVDFKFPKGRMQIIGMNHGGQGAAQINNDEDGSIYITDVSEKPFTLFVTSANGHHFSLTVKGEEGLGKTVDLIPATPAKKTAAKWEEKSSYESTLSRLMASVIHGEVPDGYGTETRAYSKKIEFSKSISLKPVRRLRGDKLMAEVFNVENKTNKKLYIRESYFSKGSLATSLSSKQLMPHAKVKLYVIRGIKNV